MRLSIVFGILFSLVSASNACDCLRIFGQKAPVAEATEKAVEDSAPPAATDVSRAGEPAKKYGHFILLLNTYRAKHGLSPLKFDAALSADAKKNNEASRPHAFLGAAKVQNWARGYVSSPSVLAAWIKSRGHRRNLLQSGLTLVGIDCTKGEWTYCAR